MNGNYSLVFYEPKKHPCRDCTERNAYCHGTCERYKEFEPPITHRGRNIICSKECWRIHQQQTKIKQQKRINQYSKDGTFIKTWESLHEIERELGLQATNICKCCKGKIKSLGGYIWKYEKEN